MKSSEGQSAFQGRWLGFFISLIAKLITVTLLPIRFTSVRVTAKYHGIKLEYRELRHTVLDLLGQIKAKLCVWGRPFISPEAVRMLLQEWHVSGSDCK